jgi:splicing factor 3B subunit 4
MNQQEARNTDATVYVGNLNEECTEDLLYELFLQVGPVVNSHIPTDRVTGQKQPYGFVEFKTNEDAEYAIKVMNMIKLFGQSIKVGRANANQEERLDVGANVFVGGLADDVDDKLLFDIFSAFGSITKAPNVVMDEATGKPKGYGFVHYDCFEASDLAIQCMNGQLICNQPIQCQYAFKKNGTPGERHGSEEERMLAQGLKAGKKTLMPHLLFATTEGDVSSIMNVAANAGQNQNIGMARPPPVPVIPGMTAPGYAYGAGVGTSPAGVPTYPMSMPNYGGMGMNVGYAHPPPLPQPMAYGMAPPPPSGPPPLPSGLPPPPSGPPPGAPSE